MNSQQKYLSLVCGKGRLAETKQAIEKKTSLDKIWAMKCLWEALQLPKSRHLCTTVYQQKAEKTSINYITLFAVFD